MNDEQEYTLEDALAAAWEDSTTEEPAEEKDLEVQENQEENEEVTETQEEGEATEESDDSTDEISAKLEELEAQYGKAEEDDPWADIRTEEQFLLSEQQALNTNFLAGLPQIKDDAGLSIYEMDQAKFDKFLQELGDDGKESLKIQAAQARDKAAEAAGEILERNKNFNTRLQQFQQRKIELEVVTDIAKQLGLPALVKKYQSGEVARHLVEKAKTDPKIAQKTQTKEGLYQLAIMAVRDLGLAPSKNQEAKKPSAPDAKSVSKKVKTKVSDNSTEALLAKASKMSSKEYAKLDKKTRERLMYASLKEAL